MTFPNRSVEHLVIGSGAGGAIAFQRYAAAGIETLLLEEGQHWSASDYKKSVSETTQVIYRNGGLTPIYGRPVIAFGEGSCLGGTTEVNGSLFWRTPEFVLEHWKEEYDLGDLFNLDFLKSFVDIEKRLGVRLEHDVPDTNIDSRILQVAAQSFKWNVARVPRSAPNCVHSNRCGSGCPTDGRSSMSLTYIKDGESSGGRILTSMKVTSISERHDHVVVTARNTITSETVVFKAQTISVCAGPTQTPILLRTMDSGSHSGSKFCFHVNAKVLAKFDEEVSATRGTIFTHQVQEFIQDGLLIMPSNLRASYLAMSFGFLGNKELTTILNEIKNYALYTIQIAPKTRGRGLYLGSKQILTHRLSHVDFVSIKNGLYKACELLFSQGATEIVLPMMGNSSVFSLAECKKQLDEVSFSKYVLSSVHMMSSSAIGSDPKKSIVNQFGLVWGSKRVSVQDASAIPSWTIESPQGSIMALSSRICDFQIANRRA